MLELETKKLSTDCSHYLDNTNAQLITLSHSKNHLSYQKLFPDKNGDFSKKCLKLPKISNSNNNPPDKVKLSKNCGIIAIQYGQTLHFFNYNRSGDHLEVPGYKFEPADPKTGNRPALPVDYKSRLLDFFWTGKSTILLVFANGLRTLLINDKQSVTCFGGFKFEEEIDFSICWSEDSNPSTRLQKDWIRNEIGKTLFNTVAIGTADAKLILFRCQETTIHQLQTIVVDRSRCAENRKGRRRSISQDCRPVSSTVGSWVMDVVSMPGRILSSSYTPKNDENSVGNSGDAQNAEYSRSRTNSRSITIEEDYLDKLSLASGHSTNSSRSGASKSVSTPKKLLRSSTNLMFVYDQLFVSVLCKSRHFYQLHLYRVLNKTQPQTLVHVLRLKRSGRFFVQIVDHLILLHHLEEKETLVFDIAYLVKRHRAISGSDGSSSNNAGHSSFFNNDSKFHYSKYRQNGQQHAMPYYHDPIAIVSLPSYSKNWKNCCNQVIFSKKYNEITRLKLNLGKVVMPLEEQSQMSQLQMDSKDVIRFLQRRIECSILEAKNAIIDYTNTSDPNKIPFHVIMEDLRQEKPVEEKVDTKTGTKSILISKHTSKSTPNSALDIKKVMLKSTQDHSRKFHFLNQREIFTKILEHPKNSSTISYTTVLSLIKTAKLFQHKPVITELHLLLVKKLIEAGQVPLLKQLLLQKIVMDDDSIGCYLLKNGHTELGLDIFRRLGADHVEQAVEVLMLTEQVERCVKYAIVNKREDCLVPARLLDLVKSDDLRFISVFNYCVKRNFRMRGTNEFSGRDRCEEYVQLYKRLVRV